MSTCKQCGAPVLWVKEGSKKLCHNPDGSDHWDLCSKLRFERIKRTGEYFQTKNGDKGYLTPLKRSGVQYVQQTSGWRKGKEYSKAAGCKHCVPAWEVCTNQCPAAVALVNRSET